MKRKLWIAYVLVLVVLLAGCGGDKTPSVDVDNGEIKTVGFVTDVNGLGDQAFNDAVHEGIKKATDELELELKTIESREIADYAPSVRALADEGVEIIVLAQNAFADVIDQVVPEYPEIKFLVFDIAVEDMENVQSITFKEEEAGYLLGAFAGLVTKKDNVGYVGGIASPVQDRAMSGFKAGYETTNPTGEITTVYTGTYSDVGKGKEIALSMFNKGADYVAAFTGAGNLGVFQAAEEKGDDFYALGAATGQFQINPDKIVASQVKTINRAVYNAIKDTVEGNFKSGTESWGVKEGGVDLLTNTLNEDLVKSLISDEDLATIDKLRLMVENNEIEIPMTEEDYESFTPPTL